MHETRFKHTRFGLDGRLRTLVKKATYRKFRTISRDFFPHFQPCGLYNDAAYLWIFLLGELKQK